MSFEAACLHRTSAVGVFSKVGRNFWDTIQNDTIEENLMSDADAVPNETPTPDKNLCPAPVVIGMIGGKWKLLILQILIFQGTKRFGELRSSIDGITQTMLTKQLRALEADGLVTRKVYAEVPPRVEYSASADGLALEPVFTSMHAWWGNRSAAG